MSQKLRPGVSSRNQYYLEKHRYYELTHFCRQYPSWKRTYTAIDGLARQNLESPTIISSGYSDPTAKYAEALDRFSRRIDLVDRTAEKTDSVMGPYILIGATEGLSYDVLRANYDIPCCRDTYYALYRKFFWLLSQERD